MRRSKRTLSDEERRLWQRVTDQVTPLDGKAARGRNATLPEAKSPVVSIPEKPAAKVEKVASDKASLPMPTARAAIPGLDRRTAEKLRRGRMEIEGTLDLHGLTQAAAHRAVCEFISRSASQGRRCVLIISGKGSLKSHDIDRLCRPATGVLKQTLPLWLSEPINRQHIIAVQRAAPRHGGEGAVYLLLRRRRQGHADR